MPKTRGQLSKKRPNLHYLKCDFDNRFGIVYEYCNLPLTYDSFDGRHLFVEPCNYYFIFRPKIQSLKQKSLIWVPSSVEKTKSLYGYMPSSESEEYCFSLQYNDSVVATIIVDGVPSPFSDGYKKDSFDSFMQYLEGIKANILNSFINAYDQ